MAEKVKEEMQHVFNPEFLNRLDDTIVFHPLAKEHIGRSSDPAQGRAEASQRGRADARLTDAGIDFLVKHGFDEQFGARPLKRAIQRYIEDPLCEKILLGEFAKGDEIEVDVSADKSKLDFRVLTSSTKA